MEWTPGYFPIRPDRRMPEKTSEDLSSRHEEMIHYAYLTSNQPAPNQTLNL